MARKELSNDVFRKCLGDKVKLYGLVTGSVNLRTYSEKGAGYVAEVTVDFGGPFHKTLNSSYDSRREALDEAIDVALDYVRKIVQPHSMDYDELEKTITLKKYSRE